MIINPKIYKTLNRFLVHTTKIIFAIISSGSVFSYAAHSGGRFQISPERKYNLNIYDTILSPLPICPRDILLKSLVLVHAGYVICNQHSFNTNYYANTFGGVPGSLNLSQCIMEIEIKHKSILLNLIYMQFILLKTSYEIN